MGLRSRWWTTFFGLPRGLMGRLGTRMMVRVSRPFSEAMAEELKLQPDDELLDVGCGSGGLLLERAGEVHHVAGIDLSELQVSMARERLSERIAAGTAEIALGDAVALPWEDGSFSVVTSVNALKFVPDPGQALREIYRVLRPGGRVAVTMGEAAHEPSAGGKERNVWGEWQWSDVAARQVAEAAGFADVAVSVMPVFSKAKLVQGTKPSG